MGAETLDEGNIAAAFKFDETKLGEAPTGSDGPSYSQMLNSMFEDIRKSVKDHDDKKQAYIKELGIHKKKIGGEIVKNENEIAKLEKEESSKITSEGLHEGFSSSVLSLAFIFQLTSSMLRSRIRNILLRKVNRNLKLKLWKLLMLRNWSRMR
jgi:hypothetical protein